jgi:hypothetical protein
MCACCTNQADRVKTTCRNGNKHFHCPSRCRLESSSPMWSLCQINVPPRQATIAFSHSLQDFRFKLLDERFQCSSVSRKLAPKVNCISSGVMAEDEAIARHIAGYGLMLAQQVEKAGGWPKKFRFPEPVTDAEREALRLFMQEVEATTGVATKVTHASAGN